MLRRLFILTIVASLSVASTEAQNYTPAVDSLLQKAEKDAAAEKTASRFLGDESMGRFDAERTRIAPLLSPSEKGKDGGAATNEDDSSWKDDASVTNGQTRILQSAERLYVFVSSSIPLVALRAMATDLARLKDPNVVIVLRGFVEGAKLIGPTSTLVAKIITDDPDCLTSGKSDCSMKPINIVIDPLLFRRYGIGRVPAVAFVQNVMVKNTEASEGIEENADSGDAWIVYGDASIPYAIELLRRETDIPSLERLSIALKQRRR
jgi:type-F conjugative transfer system pilin assembly protein TrbC